ncbi:hypothetical protein BC828DRAFT_405176 [Blastocladiella britannica]|nr:hypothetical protein BC828DRAFT_405176 [Blastocladiella britannica]
MALSRTSASERFVHIVLLRKIPWHYAVSASISTFAISHMYLAMHFVMGELQ